MDAVLQTMVDEHIGPGQRVDMFLEKLKAMVASSGTAYALRSYSSAVSYSLAIAGVKPGDTVGVSALSPAWYRVVVESAGCTLAIGDIDAETGLLSAQEARRLHDEGAAALIIHETLGNSAVPGYYGFLDIPVIYDAAESLGSQFSNQETSGTRAIVVYAFEEHHVVSTGGGSALLCQGEPFESNSRQSLAGKRDFDLNRMTDLNAALGLVQLATLNRQLQRRRELFDRYRGALMRTRHQLFGIKDIDFQSNGQAFAVLLDSKPELAIAFGAKYEVPVRLTFRDCVIDATDDRFDKFPHALPCILRAVSFPIYPFLTAQQVGQIERVIAHIP